jgi:hypothetical protein
VAEDEILDLRRVDVLPPRDDHAFLHFSFYDSELPGLIIQPFNFFSVSADFPGFISSMGIL